MRLFQAIGGGVLPAPGILKVSSGPRPLPPALRRVRWGLGVLCLRPQVVVRRGLRPRALRRHLLPGWEGPQGSLRGFPFGGRRVLRLGRRHLHLRWTGPSWASLLDFLFDLPQPRGLWSRRSHVRQNSQPFCGLASRRFF